jgi:L-lactate permease
MDDRCDACRGEALTIEVPRSIFGKAMYLTSAVALALIALYLANRDYGLGFASSIDGTLYTVLIFAIIVLSFVLSFLDLGRTNREARRIVEERRERIHD